MKWKGRPTLAESLVKVPFDAKQRTLSFNLSVGLNPIATTSAAAPNSTACIGVDFVQKGANHILEENTNSSQAIFYRKFLSYWRAAARCQKVTVSWESVWARRRRDPTRSKKRCDGCGLNSTIL